MPLKSWIRTDNSDITLGVNSLDVLLNPFFQKAAEFSKAKESDLETDEVVNVGDLVSYIDLKGEKIHSGIIIEHRGLDGVVRKWVRSKLGETVTVGLRPPRMASSYDYQRIEIWRRTDHD